MQRLASAAAAQRLLAPVAARKAREEHATNRLVIVHAEYGVLDMSAQRRAASEQEAGEH